MNKKCPVCGSRNAQEVVYGYPDMDLVEQADRGEVVLGGCCIEDDSPRWQCRDCGHEWGAPMYSVL
jgi:rubredoxin